MTADEEASFRQAARAALETGCDVIMVGTEDPDMMPPFTVARFEGQNAVAIVIPLAWHEAEGMEERCHGILRQESKALAGQGLD
ncbi:MAG TPA: hypothetical protein VK571_07835 [Gemmatimonadaceae bacterium]|nr:hypothetical protein [Gemmatimonadaceae bacterium]